MQAFQDMRAELVTTASSLPIIHYDIPISLPKHAKRPRSGATANAPDDTDELRELKHKAKYHCRDIKEWRVISKYNKKKLEEYLNDQTFLEGSEIARNFGDFATDFYGFVLDKLTKGDGYVEAEIKNDLTLKSAVQRELVEYVKHITNRIQIFVFSSINVVNGKKKQSLNAPLCSTERTSEGPNIHELHQPLSRQDLDENRAENWEPSPDSVEFGDRGEEAEIRED